MATATLSNIAKGRHESTGKIVIFVRHGESEANINATLSHTHNANPLTEKGWSHANEVARRLKELYRIDGIYTSPVLRARQTALPAARELNIRPVITPLLRERGMGKYNNVKFSSPADHRVVIDREITSNYPQIESWNSLQERGGKFIELLGGKEIVVAFSHQDTIMSHLPIQEVAGVPGPRIPQGSFTVLDFGKSGKKTVICVGSMEIPKFLLKEAEIQERVE